MGTESNESSAPIAVYESGDQVPKTEAIGDGIRDAVANKVKEAILEAFGVILANGIDIEVTPGPTVKIHLSIKRG